MADTKFIRPTAVRRYVNGKGRRVRPNFLKFLDLAIAKELDRQMEVQKNKTLDGELARARAEQKD